MSLSHLCIECVENKIQRARLRWFGQVEQKEENDWVKKCTRMNVTGVVGKVLQGKHRGVVSRDMMAMGIKEGMAHDSWGWRNITGDPTRASADAGHTSKLCVLFRMFNAYDLPGLPGSIQASNSRSPWMAISREKKQELKNTPSHSSSDDQASS